MSKPFLAITEELTDVNHVCDGYYMIMLRVGQKPDENPVISRLGWMALR